MISNKRADIMICIADEPKKQSEKPEQSKRPPRTKKMRVPSRMKFVMWLTIGVIVVGVFVTFAPATRWVEGSGFITTSSDAEMRPSVEGVVDRWLTHTNDRVERDQVILQLNANVQRADFEQTKSELAAKQAELAQLQSAQELDRAQRKEQIQRAEQNVKLAQAYADRMHNGGFSPKEV